MRFSTGHETSFLRTDLNNSPFPAWTRQELEGKKVSKCRVAFFFYVVRWPSVSQLVVCLSFFLSFFLSVCLSAALAYLFGSFFLIHFWFLFFRQNELVTFPWGRIKIAIRYKHRTTSSWTRKKDCLLLERRSKPPPPLHLSFSLSLSLSLSRSDKWNELNTKMWLKKLKLSDTAKLFRLRLLVQLKRVESNLKRV